MQDVIDAIRDANIDVVTPLELPDFDDVVAAEEEICVPLYPDFKEFLLTVSDVVCGSIEPVTVADPSSHTHLPEVAAYAWSIGLSREHTPICAHDGGFYAVTIEGAVVYWTPESGEIEEWTTVWEWAREVWLVS
ncbi:SMI1/KNR4 family protein [Amphritea sp.]|uniref:SMI1/KNR4 family protein n=1 Tax=Amphritea sp. TaxID=1872502 RepID=UPI003A941CE9